MDINDVFFPVNFSKIGKTGNNRRDGIPGKKRKTAHDEVRGTQNLHCISGLSSPQKSKHINPNVL